MDDFGEYILSYSLSFQSTNQTVFSRNTNETEEKRIYEKRFSQRSVQTIAINGKPFMTIFCLFSSD